MLPFLKNKQEAAIVDGEDQPESYGIAEAIADDIFEAMEKKNKPLLTSAIKALCDYIKEEDEEQDQTLENKE